MEIFTVTLALTKRQAELLEQILTDSKPFLDSTSNNETCRDFGDIVNVLAQLQSQEPLR